MSNCSSGLRSKNTHTRQPGLRPFGDVVVEGIKELGRRQTMALTLSPLGLGTGNTGKALLMVCSVVLVAPSVSLPSQKEQTLLSGLRANSDEAQRIMDQFISKI